ncbi:MAG: CDP-alcohol phosphatidyltransferase family protein, partial [bacterium]
MNIIRKVSVKELRSNYKEHQKSEQDKNELLGFYVFRRLSFYPTAISMNMGLTANQTTWISIFINLAGIILLAVGDYLSALLGASMLIFWLVLDSVDGNIARYEKSCSLYGEFIDALGAYIAHLSIFAAGIGFYFSRNSLLLQNFELPAETYSAGILIVGAVASLSAILIRLIYQKFKNTFTALKFDRDDALDVKDNSSIKSRLMNMGHNIFNLSGCLLPGLLLAIAVN